MDHFLKVFIEFFYNIASLVYVLFFFGGGWRDRRAMRHVGRLKAGGEGETGDGWVTSLTGWT